MDVYTPSKRINRQAFLRRGFIVAAICFVAILAGTVLYRSSSRATVVRATTALLESPEKEKVVKQETKEESKLQLHDFHRVQVKDGRPIWEVKAKDATYFPKQSLTHVNDATVKVFRERKPTIVLQSRVARLYLKQDNLQEAELEGNIRVSIEGSLIVTADVGTYNVVHRKISSPARVDIKGDGFMISGVGLDLDIETEEIMLKEEVESLFKPGAKAPSGLEMGGAEKGTG